MSGTHHLYKVKNQCRNVRLETPSRNGVMLTESVCNQSTQSRHCLQTLLTVSSFISEKSRSNPRFCQTRGAMQSARPSMPSILCFHMMMSIADSSLRLDSTMHIERDASDMYFQRRHHNCPSHEEFASTLVRGDEQSCRLHVVCMSKPHGDIFRAQRDDLEYETFPTRQAYCR